MRMPTSEGVSLRVSHPFQSNAQQIAAAWKGTCILLKPLSEAELTCHQSGVAWLGTDTVKGRGPRAVPSEKREMSRVHALMPLIYRVTSFLQARLAHVV